MDSLSQIVLGAAIGELVAGKKIGNKAILLGAIAGTIPDLDILFSPFFENEITKLQIHRGHSHALFTHIFLALPFAWLTHILFKKRFSFSMWYWLWFLGFSTHALLDCCTTYGTQFFLPFSNFLVGFNNISVVDPFWTIPFLVTLVVVMFYKRDNPKRYKWAMAGVIYNFLYMGFTLVNKYNVHQHFKSELKRQHINVDQLYTSPAIFNNFLWSGIATTTDSIYLAEYSILQQRKSVKWISYPIHESLLENNPNHHEIDVLKWFSQGKYFVQEVNGELHFFMAKWGRADFTENDVHDSFVFYWRIYQENGKWLAAPAEPQWEDGEFTKAWNALWRRVITADDY